MLFRFFHQLVSSLFKNVRFLVFTYLLLQDSSQRFIDSPPPAAPPPPAYHPHPASSSSASGNEVLDLTSAPPPPPPSPPHFAAPSSFSFGHIMLPTSSNSLPFLHHHPLQLDFKAEPVFHQ